MSQTRGPRIVVLTAPGISRESGLDTFRDADGIWARGRIEDVTTPEAFASDPVRVHDFYNDRRRRLLSEAVRPNLAHCALAELESALDDRVLVVTQNIDNLHERVGSRNLIHMHGELLKASCVACGAALEWRADLSVETPCPDCGARGGLRPHVVWFGEMPLEMDRIAEALEACHLFLSIGTSGVVYPAAGFVRAVRARGLAHTVELNLEPSAGHGLFAERLYRPPPAPLPRVLRRLLEHGR